MSSSFRSRMLRRPGIRCAWSAAAFLVAVPAAGADTYFTPTVELATEYYSNRDLSPPGTAFLDGSVQGYLASIGATTGFRTPRGSTSIRPRIVFQEYPDRDDLQRANAYLDLRSRYAGLRTGLNVNGRFRREDRTNAQLTSAVIDDFDPDEPLEDNGSRINLFSETVTDWSIRPSISHEFTQRVGATFSAGYQDVSFDSDVAARGVSYENLDAAADLRWQLRERSEVTTGIYGGRYVSDRSDNETYNIGLSLGLLRHWTPLYSGTFKIQAERTEVNLTGEPSDTSTNFGATVGISRTGQLGVVRMSLGRILTPSSYGSRNRRDEFLLQFNRSITPRWQLTSALRAFRSEALGDATGTGNNRTFGRVEMNLRWAASRTLYVSGGYTYTAQKYSGDDKAGTGNIFALRFGYQALPPQPR